MDLVRLIGNGTYKKEELNEKNKSFIDGMEYVLEEVVTEDFFDETDFGDCLSPTLRCIQAETAAETIKRVREYLKIEICEVIISCAEEEETVREHEKGKETYKETKNINEQMGR